jgi:hypothetical protein
MLDPYQKSDLFSDVNRHPVDKGREVGFDLRRGAFAKLFETVFGTERTNRGFLLTVYFRVFS